MSKNKTTTKVKDITKNIKTEVTKSVEVTKNETKPAGEVPNLITEIISFMNYLKGKSSLTNIESKKMFDLYNKYYGATERNTGCDLCAIRIYKKLKNIKDNYEKNK